MLTLMRASASPQRDLESAASRVHALLEARGSTHRWLAKKLGVHHTLLSKYLSGALPSPSGLYPRIADVLHVPVEFVTPTPEKKQEVTAA